MTVNPSVAVLLTAFNGIKWINEQVNSILYSVIQSLRDQADIKIHTKNL